MGNIDNKDAETARNNADKSYATEIKNLKLATFHLLAKGDAYSLLVSRSKNYKLNACITIYT